MCRGSWWCRDGTEQKYLPTEQAVSQVLCAHTVCPKQDEMQNTQSFTYSAFSVDSQRLALQHHGMGLRVYKRQETGLTGSCLLNHALLLPSFLFLHSYPMKQDTDPWCMKSNTAPKLSSRAVLLKAWSSSHWLLVCSISPATSFFWLLVSQGLQPDLGAHQVLSEMPSQKEADKPSVAQGSTS